MDLKDQKVLVTGGAGFVGSHLAQRLLETGCFVMVVDDLSNGSRQNMAEVLEHPRFKFVEGSVADAGLVSSLISTGEFAVVFHLAALNLLRSVENPSNDLRVNVLGTLSLLQAIQAQNEQGIRKTVMVYSSTGSVYGEPDYNPQDEGHPLQPVSPYGISKLAAEKYVLLWHKVFGVPGIALRYYNVYGPRQSRDPKGGVVGIFLSRLMQGLPTVIEGDGHQERCFTFVDDVVRANILAATQEEAWGGVYNIGTSEITTINQLSELASRLCKSELKPQYTKPRIGDVRSFQPTLTLAEKHLGYRPKVKLAEGLVKTRDWIATLL